MALIGRGAAHVELGELAPGRADLLEAEARLAGAGSTLYLPDLYRELAGAELAAGNVQAADEAVARSLQYAQAAAAIDQIAMTQRTQAQVELARGNVGRAHELLTASLQALREIGDIGESARTESVLQTLESASPQA